MGQREYEQAIATYRDGKVEREKVHVWSQRLMQAQIDLAAGSYLTDPKSRAIYVAAAKAHREAAGYFEEGASRQRRAGGAIARAPPRPGNHLDVRERKAPRPPEPAQRRALLRP